MQVIMGLENLRDVHRGVLFLALGNFDGVHIGHRAIISATYHQACAQGGKSGVLIFNPHPLQILSPGKSPALLLTLEERIQFLGASGIDYIIVHPFTAEFAQLEPEEFAARILVDELKVSGVIVGFNYSFGSKGKGTTGDLKALGERHGFSVQVIDPVEKDGAPVASSRIRSLIAVGRVEEAMEMLGYAFSLKGRVIHGDGRGRQLGFPTANIEISGDKINPGHGVYLTRASLLGEGCVEAHWALTNVGRRPTFGKTEPQMEVYLLDAQKNLYGQELNVQFIQKIREERVFAGAPELAEQIKKDEERARRLIDRRTRKAEKVSNVANGQTMW